MGYTIREITLKEKIFDRPDTKNYFRTVYPRIQVTADPKATVELERAMYEVVQVHPPYGGEPFFLSFDITQYPTLRALLGHTEQTIERKMEDARENERWFSKYMIGLKIREIKALPWYKRLFNKF